MKRNAIPIKTRREIEWRFGLGCGYPGCKKPAMDLHHTKRFSLVKRHSEGEIVPLCKVHHELVHAGLLRGEQLAPRNWDLEIEIEKNGAEARVDELVREKRRGIRQKRESGERGGKGVGRHKKARDSMTRPAQCS